jgi:hypothetical protein
LEDGRDFFATFDLVKNTIAEVAKAFCTKHIDALQLQNETDLISCFNSLIVYIRGEMIKAGFTDGDAVEPSAIPSV